MAMCCACCGRRLLLFVRLGSKRLGYLLSQPMVLCLRRRIPRFLDRSAHSRLYLVCRIG